MRGRTGNKEAALGFRRSQLLYDIENGSYIEGDILERDSYHQRQVIQDVGQRGNVDRITRIIDLSVARCRERLYPYTKEEVGVDRVALNDVLHDDPVYWIFLRIPETFSRTTLIYLEKLIHEFIVCRAMIEWMRLTNPVKVESWEARADELEEEIKNCLKRRTGKMRRQLHPF